MFLLLRRLFLAVVVCVGIVFCLNPTYATGYPWHEVGSTHFAGYTVNSAPIAMSTDGTIYIAYSDVANSNKASVMKYDGDDWSLVGEANFSSGGTDSISLAVDATGTPYVAYVNTASSSRANVMKFDGSSWVTVGNANFSTSSIEQTVIAINPAGIPYVTFIDVGNDRAPTTMKLNGSTWEMVGTAYGAQGGAPSIVFSTSSIPYVAFSDIATGVPTVITFSGATSSWLQVGDLSSVNLYGNCPIAISPSGTLYLVTSDVLTDGNPISVFTFDGSMWNQLGDTVAISNGGNFQIAINQNGIPYISLIDLDTGKGTVIAYQSSAWSVLGNALFTSSVQGSVLPLVIGQNGGPYISYSDASLSDYRLTVMAYLPTVPGRLTGLSAVTGSAGSIGLSWNPVANTGGSAIIGYRVQRESPVGGGFVTVVPNTNSTALGYADVGLEPGRTYNYRVFPLNSVGVGLTTSTASATTIDPGGMSFVPVTPRAVGDSGLALAFSLHDGTSRTTSPLVRLRFNADPQFVRGYAASLDPNFKQASIYPLSESSFVLPPVPGTYTIYLKYYSTTGEASPVLSQTISYQPAPVVSAAHSLKPAVSASLASSDFVRVLQVGSVGSDVKALQQFLNQRGFVVAKVGPGSPNHETDTFGLRTATALRRFQQAHGIFVVDRRGNKITTGVFGEVTREIVKKMRGKN